MNHSLCSRVSALVSSAPESATALPSDLQEHCEQCLTCQLLLTHSTRLTSLLERSGEPWTAPSGLADKALGAAPSRPGSNNARWILPLAAGLALAIGAAAFLQQGTQTTGGTVLSTLPEKPAPTPDGTPEPEPAPELEPQIDKQVGLTKADCQGDQCASGAVFETTDSRKTIQLSDKTTLQLNTGTRVELVAGAERRMRLVHGTILLEVTKQAPLPPLAIITDAGEVLVTGTRLSITAEAGRSVVDVIRGTVEIAGMPVRAGQEAIMTPGEAPRITAAGDLAAITEWAELQLPEPEGTMGLGSLVARRPGAEKGSSHALALAEHTVSVNIRGVVARTTVEEAFRNDSKHTLEGTYTFPLPSGARIAGLDLLVDGEWMHGAVVERERGEKIWRGVIKNATPKKKQRKMVEEWIWVPGPWKDPAILTWKAGTTFDLRIFPIPARGERRVRIHYTQTLPKVADSRRYTYPLPFDPSGKARAERFSFAADSGSRPRVTGYAMKETDRGASFEATQFTPTGDIVVDVPEQKRGAELTTWAFKPEAGAGHGLLAMSPKLPTLNGSRDLDLLFVIDSSWSTQSERMQRAARLVKRVTRELSKESRVHVLACAETCRSIGPGFRSADLTVAQDLHDRVAALTPLGATWIEHAIGTARVTLDAAQVAPGKARIIYVGDGTAAMGERDTAKAAALVKQRLRGVRLTTISLGGDVDEAMLSALAGAGGGAYVEHGPSETLRATAFALLQRQWEQPLTDVALELPPGLTAMAPSKLDAIWPGQEVLVAARLEGGIDGEAVIRGRSGGEPFEVRFPLRLEPAKGNGFLPRLWAEARIDELQATGGDTKTIVELSKAHHVLSRHTSLLVLESVAMARAFKVEDTRPAVDWTGTDDTTAVSHNADSGADEDDDLSEATKKTARTSNRAPKAREQVRMSGMMGGDAKGVGGLSTGSSSPLGRRETRVGTVKMGKMSSSGRLDASVIQRVVRRHANQVRRIYERALQRNPNISGRADIKFTISTIGRVTDATATGSLPKDLRDALANLVKRWRFPTGDAPVTVRYPFVFQPSGDRIVRDNFMGGRSRGGRWQKRKKVWRREYSLKGARGVRPHERRELAKRETALAESPDSRDRTRDLIRWHLRLGDLDAARSLTEAWLTRDRMDAGALVTLSDIEAADGDMERSRSLLASAVDVDPTSEVAHERMMALYFAAGDELRACAHVSGECKTPNDGKLRDTLTISAEWDTERDLDIVVITPKGRRVSWQGGAKRTASRDALDLHKEGLAMSAGELGRYQVLMVERRDGKPATSAVSGKVTIRTRAGRKTFSFTTDDGIARAGELHVKSNWEWQNVGGRR